MNDIKKIRIERGYSTKDVSVGSGIPYRTLQDWEAGKRKPRDVYQIQKLADYYGCQIEDLIGKAE
jgi:transcriptional regulator with XRE-family HTH domain